MEIDQRGKARPKQAAAPATAIEKAPETFGFSSVFDCLTGDTVISGGTHEATEAEGEVESTVSSTLRNSGTEGKPGLIQIFVTSNFDGKTFHPDLVDHAREGIAATIKQCLRSESRQQWRPPTDDYGLLRLIAIFQPRPPMLPGSPTEASQAPNRSVKMIYTYDACGATVNALIPDTAIMKGDYTLGELIKHPVSEITKKQKIHNNYLYSFYNITKYDTYKIDNILDTETVRIYLNDDTNHPDPSPSTDERPKFLTDLLAAKSKDIPYDRLAATLADAIHAFRGEIAARLQPALNAQACAMPQATYEEKKEVAKWINGELRRFDLAIKCPKTGMPSSMLVDKGNHPLNGRFQLEHKSAEGKRVKSLSSPDLPPIELIESAPRREALTEWHERIRRQGGGSKRG